MSSVWHNYWIILVLVVPVVILIVILLACLVIRYTDRYRSVAERVDEACPCCKPAVNVGRPGMWKSTPLVL